MIHEKDQGLLAAINKAAEAERPAGAGKPSVVARMASDGANKGLFDVARKALSEDSDPQEVVPVSLTESWKVALGKAASN